MKRVALVSILTCSLVTGGCAVVGGAVGAASGSSTVHPPTALDRLRETERARLFLFDGSSRRGRFHGVSKGSDADYAASWKERTRRLGMDLELGPASVDGIGLRGDFLGVELHGVEIRTVPHLSATLVPWSTFSVLTDTRGRQVHSTTLADHVGNGHLPTRTRVDIVANGRRESYPLGDIVQVTTNEHSRFGHGVAAGLALDILAIVLVRRSLQDWSVGGY